MYFFHFLYGRLFVLVDPEVVDTMVELMSSYNNLLLNTNREFQMVFIKVVWKNTTQGLKYMAQVM